MVALSNFSISSLALMVQRPFLASAQELPPGMTVGSDGPADEATRSYWVNHLGFNVRNLAESKNFYGNVLGLREIFTIQYTPNFSMTYMGYPQGGRNGTGFQSGEKMLRDKNQMGGLIKLFYFAIPASLPVASTERTNTFSNIGLIVPDIQATQDRLEKHGAKIVKRLGEKTISLDGPIANAMNIGPASTSDTTEGEALVEGLQTTFFESVLFVEDPDGNLIEILEQDGF
jgi:lactoylglutathione lyase